MVGRVLGYLDIKPDDSPLFSLLLFLSLMLADTPGCVVVLSLFALQV